MHLKPWGALVLALAFAATSSAAPTDLVIVQPHVAQPDNITRPALVTFMRQTESPTIVLRVPAPQAAVSQSQGSQGSADLNQAYLAIEKELVKAGFVVRDRGLLEEILRSNQNLDYKGIQQKIDAQLILEIVSIAPRSYATNAFVDARNHRDGQLKSGDFAISGWHFESRVVMVNSGEIGGIYSADIVPQDLHFIVAGRRILNATAQGKVDKEHLGYGFGPVEQAAPLFVRTFIFELKPSLARAGLGVFVEPMTPDNVKKLGFKIPKKVNGVIVASVERQSRAAESGLQAGDVIEAINGHSVIAPNDVVAATSLSGTMPMQVKVNRGGKELSLTVPAP